MSKLVFYGIVFCTLIDEDDVAWYVGIIFIFSIVKKAAFLIKRYFVASMGAKVEVLAHPGDKYCADRQAG